MTYNFISSLEQLTRSKIALTMYFDNDIAELMEAEIILPIVDKRLDRSRLELWKEVERKVVEKLNFFPVALQVQLSKFIQPIHMEVKLWMFDHKMIFGLGNNSNYYSTCKSVLCWKSYGIIDRKKTARKIVENRGINSKVRFAIACIYFLEDELLTLWSNQKTRQTIKGLIITNASIRFWTRYLKSGPWEKEHWKALIENHFQISTIQPFDVPLRVSSFFPYLSWATKQQYFPYLVNESAIHQDDFRVCVQMFDDAGFMRLNYIYPSNSLACVLQWPFQSLFMEMARQLCPYMNELDFHFVMDNIVMNYILEGLGDFDYVELLKEFWHIIPPFFKDKIKEIGKYFAAFDVVLHYRKENSSLSLPEILDSYIDWN